MACANRVGLVALLALALCAQLVAARRWPDYKQIPGAKKLVVPYSARTITLYDLVDFPYTDSSFISLRGSSNLFSDFQLADKVGQLNIVVDNMLTNNNVVMFTASLNFGIGYVTASAAEKWTDNWVELAITGATGDFARFSAGTLRITKIASANNVRDSIGHILQLTSLV
ncbi:hypothetical protein CLOM_g4017 [Closterium sp. NIES-68]|nr:hypothetical protein CLOM_g4017 [Closterium sp. NIES-68]GJP72536.1 hypothetical protein CLOP_g3261 [Closterium sp. NIES-67]